jgi:hypothetical protein
MKWCAILLQNNMAFQGHTEDSKKKGGYHEESEGVSQDSNSHDWSFRIGFDVVAGIGKRRKSSQS